MNIYVTDMWKYSFFRFGRERRYKPVKKNGRREGAEELCTHKSRCINWTDPGKCVREGTRERHGRIRKAG